MLQRHDIGVAFLGGFAEQTFQLLPLIFGQLPLRAGILLLTKGAILLKAVVVLLCLRVVSGLRRVCRSFTLAQQHAETQQLLQPRAEGLMMRGMKAGDLMRQLRLLGLSLGQIGGESLQLGLQQRDLGVRPTNEPGALGKRSGNEPACLRITVCAETLDDMRNAANLPMRLKPGSSR